MPRPKLTFAYIVEPGTCLALACRSRPLLALSGRDIFSGIGGAVDMSGPACTSLIQGHYV